MNTKKSFHIDFKLQGESFKNKDEILSFSKTLSSEVHAFLAQWFNKKVYVEVQTSGSTGAPKTIRLQKIILGLKNRIFF